MQFSVINEGHPRRRILEPVKDLIQGSALPCHLSMATAIYMLLKTAISDFQAELFERQSDVDFNSVYL